MGTFQCSADTPAPNLHDNADFCRAFFQKRFPVAYMGARTKATIRTNSGSWDLKARIHTDFQPLRRENRSIGRFGPLTANGSPTSGSAATQPP